MGKFDRYVELRKKLRQSRKDLRAAEANIIEWRNFFDYDSSVASCACVKMYNTPLLFSLYKMPNESFEYAEYCKNFKPMAFCENVGCPMHDNNKKFISAYQKYEQARFEKNNFLKSLFKIKTK